MNKIKPEIKDDIAETLFIPLLSRAHESHRKDAILKDPMACELVEKIDYDFAKFGKITMSTTGTTIRLRHFDRLVQRFIDRKVTEDPVVVSIGCGLDSRFQRVSNHTKKEASNGEQRSKLLFDAINQVKQELNATSKNVQEKLHAMGNTPQKKIVTHRFEPTSKYVLLFIGGLALSLVISIWGNFTQWREYQDWEEADLKYRALKMVLPSDDPNVRYIEKFFSVCRDEKVIDDVKNRVAAYEDSVYHHYKMVKMAAIKDSIANSLFKEANEIKKKINKK